MVIGRPGQLFIQTGLEPITDEDEMLDLPRPGERVYVWPHSGLKVQDGALPIADGGRRTRRFRCSRRRMPTTAPAAAVTARGYAAAMAQIGAGNIDAFICPLNEPPGGQASTYNINFSGVATAAGAIDLTVCGQPIVSGGVAIGDPAAIVTQNVQAAIAELLDIPVTSTVSNATITLTYVHKGDVGEDLPVRVNITRATGILCSPGHITFVGAPSNPGSIRITIGATTITVIVAGNETLAHVIQKVVAAINAGGYPVTAAADATTVVRPICTSRPVGLPKRCVDIAARLRLSHTIRPARANHRQGTVRSDEVVVARARSSARDRIPTPLPSLWCIEVAICFDRISAHDAGGASSFPPSGPALVGVFLRLGRKLLGRTLGEDDARDGFEPGCELVERIGHDRFLRPTTVIR
jgi:hypothetical protein